MTAEERLAAVEGQALAAAAVRVARRVPAAGTVILTGSGVYAAPAVAPAPNVQLMTRAAAALGAPRVRRSGAGFDLDAWKARAAALVEGPA